MEAARRVEGGSSKLTDNVGLVLVDARVEMPVRVLDEVGNGGWRLASG